jgi:hypothetical protein
MGTLQQHQKVTLRKAGFTIREINQLNNARTPDGKLQHLNLTASNFRDMVRHRKEYRLNLRKLGWTDDQIDRRVNMYYIGHRSKRSIFSLLQVENSPSQKYKRLTDTEISRKLLARTRISKNMGRAYGRPLKTFTIPRNIPKPPRFPNM